MIDSSETIIMRHLEDIMASPSEHSRCYCRFMLWAQRGHYVLPLSAPYRPHRLAEFKLYWKGNGHPRSIRGLSLTICRACHELHNWSYAVLRWFVYTPFHHNIQMPSRNALSDVANICHSLISVSKGKLCRQERIGFLLFILGFLSWSVDATVCLQ